MTDFDRAQREILRTLLAAHPCPIGVDELHVRVSGDLRVDEALRVLVADGVATQRRSGGSEPGCGTTRGAPH